MKTFAIETSCDDTSLAVVRFDGEKFIVDKLLLHSQVMQHTKFGGVVPELASRLHEEKIIDLLQAMGIKEIVESDFISFTCCPGLPGSLLVGKTLANVLSAFLNKEKVSVNHIFGHIFSIFLDRSIDYIDFPLVVLTVSGGHNHLYIVFKNQDEELEKKIDTYYESFLKNYSLEKKDVFFQVGGFKLFQIGFSLDDAAGEAFDKVSKMLGGPYPGGKWISQQAKDFFSQINKNEFNEEIYFPRIWLKKNEFNFSFSGLKAQVNYAILNLKKKYGNLDSKIVSYIAYEFQEAVVETLGKKLLKAAKFFGISNIAITGGVSANSRLREFILDNKQKYGIENFYTPAKLVYSTDNAAMIGVVGLLNKIAF